MSEMGFDVVVGAFLTSISFLFGGWTDTMTMLAVILVIELGTGICGAAVQGKLNSKKLKKGLFGKGLIFIVLILAHFIDVILGLGSVFMTAAVIWYIGTESVSILENAQKLGVKFPKFLIDKFEQMVDDTETKMTETVEHEEQIIKKTKVERKEKTEAKNNE